MDRQSSDDTAGKLKSVSSTDAFYRLLRVKLAEGRIGEALQQLADFVRTCIADPRSVARVFADSGLDAICQEIGARALVASDLTDFDPDETSATDCIVLATRIYRTGGHTAVIEDLIESGRFGSRVRLLCTNLDLESPDVLCQISAERFGAAVECHVAPAGSLAEKLDWTLRCLALSRAKTLILMNHNYDSVAIAAAQQSLGLSTIFYHHADHQLCLGVSLAHAIHVDPSPMGYHNCKGNLNVEAPRYWPLVCLDPGRPTASKDRDRHWIRSCSSGSEGKFAFPFKYSYFDIVPEILALTQGEHVHIGPLSKKNLQRIFDGLDRLGVARDRFVHIAWVRSVAVALQHYDVDLYLASFPLGGGKTMIEAMAAGKPIVAHNSYISPFFGGLDMLYDGAFAWIHPEQLLRHVATLDRDILIDEGLKARSHFEDTHTLERFREAIDAGADVPAPPPERKNASDALQLYLDDVQYSETRYRDEFASKNEQASLRHRSEIDSLQRAHDLEIEEMIRAATQRVKIYKL